jgi:hypothetical protein
MSLSMETTTPSFVKDALSRGLFDRLAMALSGLCVAHCIGTAALLGLMASAGGLLGNPLFHEVGLLLAIILGAVALGYGALTHAFMMPAAIGSLGLGVMAGALSLPHGSEEGLYTVFGVALLALGHELNRRAGH